MRKVFYILFITMITYHTDANAQIDTREYANWSNYPEIVLFEGKNSLGICSASCIGPGIIITESSCYKHLGIENTEGSIVDYKDREAKVEFMWAGELRSPYGWAIYKIKDSDICKNNYINIINPKEYEGYGVTDVVVLSFDESKIFSDSEITRIQEITKRAVEEENSTSEEEKKKRQYVLQRFADRLVQRVNDEGISLSEKVEFFINGKKRKRGKLKIYKDCKMEERSPIQKGGPGISCPIMTYSIGSSSPVKKDNNLIALTYSGNTVLDEFYFYHDGSYKIKDDSVNWDREVIPSSLFYDKYKSLVKPSVDVSEAHSDITKNQTQQNYSQQSGSSGGASVVQQPVLVTSDIGSIVEQVEYDSGLERATVQVSQAVDTKRVVAMEQELEKMEEQIEIQMEKVENMSGVEIINFVHQVVSYSELREKYEEALAREQSLSNRMLGAAAIGATGIGGAMLGAGLAEKAADEKAERDMTAYIETMRCEYADGKSVRGGETNIELPGGNDLVALYTEYANLANSLKMRKNELGIAPGIESEVVVDKSATGLYDNVGTGIVGGGYASVYRALTNPDGDDAKMWAEQKDTTEQKTKTGGTVAGAGAVGGLVGNVAINGFDGNGWKSVQKEPEKETNKNK